MSWKIQDLANKGSTPMVLPQAKDKLRRTSSHPEKHKLIVALSHSGPWLCNLCIRHTFYPHHGTSTSPSLWCSGIYPGFNLSTTCASCRTYVLSRSPATVVSLINGFLPVAAHKYFYPWYTSTSHHSTSDP